MKSSYKVVKLIFLLVSLLILGLGFFAPDSDSITNLIGVMAFAALLLIDIYTPQIAGLSKENPKLKTMRRLNHFTMALIVLGFGIIQWVPEVKEILMEEEELFSVIVASVIMLVIGNAAPKIPFNRYMGLRLPWTIRDEETWKIAHKLLGYLTFPVVIILIVGSMFGDPITFVKYGILTWVIIPAVYSGLFYYQRLSGKK